MSKDKTIIVVGSAYGGLHAAASARACNDVARIIVFDNASSAKSINADSVGEEHFCKLHGVLLKKHARIVSLDPDARCLLLDNQGLLERLPFDSLVFAGNVENIGQDTPGMGGSRVVHFPNDSLENTVTKAVAEGAKQALVIGCGYYGIEAALALHRSRLKVTIIDRKMRVMPEYSLPFSHAILTRLENEGIGVKLGQTIVNTAQENDGELRLSLSSGEELVSDLVVASAGIRPQVSLLAHAGAALDPDGLIRVDDYMATTIPHVYACGSAIKVPFVITGERKWILEPSTLLKTAQAAGRNAAIGFDAAKEKPKPFCQTMLIEVNGTYFARTGLNEQETRAVFGDDNMLITTTYGPTDDKMPSKPSTCIRLLLDKNSHHIVGGEVYGNDSVDGRISLLSVAILNGWCPDQILDADLAYIGSSGYVPDPLNEALGRVKFALESHPLMISAETLALWLKSKRDFRLVDVGDTPMLFGRSVGNMLHMPLEALRRRVEEFTSSDSPIVLCSASGRLSDLAQRALIERGVANVYHLDGGLETFNMVFSKRL